MIGIGGFDKVNRRGKRTRESQVLFNGKLYGRNASGYYICSTGGRERLHVSVWKKRWNREDVPPGCVIHHLDWNKNNNKWENLVCVTIEEHERIHNIIGGEDGKRLGYEIAEVRNLKNGLDGLPGGMI